MSNFISKQNIQRKRNYEYTFCNYFLINISRILRLVSYWIVYSQIQCMGCCVAAMVGGREGELERTEG